MTGRLVSTRTWATSALAGLLFGILSCGVASADPFRIYAAGSLGVVLPQLIAASGLAADAVAVPDRSAACQRLVRRSRSRGLGRHPQNGPQVA